MRFNLEVLLFKSVFSLLLCFKSFKKLRILVFENVNSLRSICKRIYSYVNLIHISEIIQLGSYFLIFILESYKIAYNKFILGFPQISQVNS